MGKALHKRLFLSFLDYLTIVVVNIMIDIYHRFIYVANPMPEQVDSHHRVGEAFRRVIADVNFVAILCPKILAETQRLGVEPCFL